MKDAVQVGQEIESMYGTRDPRVAQWDELVRETRSAN
jgi:hypothetical protein